MKLPSFPVFSGQKNQPDDKFVPFPDLTQKEPSKKIRPEYVIFTVSLLIFLGTLGFYLTSKDSLSGSKLYPESSQQAQAAPCTTKVLPGGKQVYSYSHGKNVVGPKLQKVTVDPFDPQPGETITISAEIKHDSPVIKTAAILVTDNKSTSKKMQLVSGDKISGVWTTKIKLEDSYLCTYQLNFDLQSETGNYQGGMTYRP